jgi:hypothetical protein
MNICSSDSGNMWHLLYASANDTIISFATSRMGDYAFLTQNKEVGSRHMKSDLNF